MDEREEVLPFEAQSILINRPNNDLDYLLALGLETCISLSLPPKCPGIAATALSTMRSRHNRTD